MPHWRGWTPDAPTKAPRGRGAGIDCILKCQIDAGGIRTGWCQQHDREDVRRRHARTFELASCCPQETTEIIRFLMRVDEARPPVVEAIDDAVGMAGPNEAHGNSRRRVPPPSKSSSGIEPISTSWSSRMITAPPIWARHYEIGTDRPVFAGRDAVKRYRLGEIERDRRTGTPWYGEWPRSLLASEYLEWRNRLPGTVPIPELSIIDRLRFELLHEVYLTVISVQ